MGVAGLIQVLPLCSLALVLIAYARGQEGLLDSIVDKNSELLVASVQDLVRIRSAAGDPEPAAPFGPGPKAALEKALAVARTLGFPRVENLDNIAGFAEFGSGPEYIMALGHLDTVPEGGNWTHPPFGGEIEGGKIFGRGSLDDKGPALAALFAAKGLMESGIPLSRRVRVVFGTDEETGDMDMVHYLSREQPPVAGFTPDADFPVVFAEKGILHIALESRLTGVARGTAIISINGGTVINMVPDLAVAEIRVVHRDRVMQSCALASEKTGGLICVEEKHGRIQITSHGESAHASKPWEGKNAIMQLLSFLSEQKLGPSEMTDAIRFLDRAIGMRTDGKGLGVDLKDAISGTLTLNAGLITADEDAISIALDIRYPVTVSEKRVTDLLKAGLSGSRLSAHVLKHQPPLYQPADSALVSQLVGIYRDVTGDQSPPVAIGGGTYARRVPNIVAFGPYRPGIQYNIHKQEECIEIVELVTLAKIYARAMLKLAI